MCVIFAPKSVIVAPVENTQSCPISLTDTLSTEYIALFLPKKRNPPPATEDVKLKVKVPLLVIVYNVLSTSIKTR